MPKTLYIAPKKTQRIAPFVFKSAIPDCSLPKTALTHWVQSLAPWRLLSLWMSLTLSRGDGEQQALPPWVIIPKGIIDSSVFPSPALRGYG